MWVMIATLITKSADQMIATISLQAMLHAIRSLEIAAAGVPTTGGAETPAGSSTSGEADADTTTVTADGGNGATTTPISEEEAAGAHGDMGDTQAPAVSLHRRRWRRWRRRSGPVPSRSTEPSPAAETLSPSSTAPANDNKSATSGGDHKNDAQQEAREPETQPDEITPPHVSTPLFEDDEETAITGAAAEPVPSGTPEASSENSPTEPLSAAGTE